jgi:GAF domain-containing protein
LARIASHSIETAHLYAAGVRAQEQLVTLQSISRLAASARDVDEVLPVVLRETAEIMGDSQVWLWLAGEGGGRLQSWAPPKGESAWTPVHQAALEYVLRAGQPIFYDPRIPVPPTPILLDRGAAMCAPVEGQSEPIGALVVVNRQPNREFTEEDMIVLRTVANAAAAALRSVR